jgi:Cytochrome P450
MVSRPPPLCENYRISCLFLYSFPPSVEPTPQPRVQNLPCVALVLLLSHNDKHMKLWPSSPQEKHNRSMVVTSSVCSVSSPLPYNFLRIPTPFIVRSNMASEPGNRMSTEETLCQISTFITAGHETTASALTWCLYALSQAPATQRKLRDALLSLPPPPTLKPSDYSQPLASSPELQHLTDALSRLPYLDWVVRESLRLHSPVTSTMRVCMRDADVIPVAEPYIDRHGVPRHAIAVNKYDIITVPIQAINKNPRIWGENASIFRYAI